MRDARPSEVKVGDVMTSPVVSVEPGADVTDVSRKHAAVSGAPGPRRRGSRLVGIISTADLARASARKEGHLGEEVETVMEKVSADKGSVPGPEAAAP